MHTIPMLAFECLLWPMPLPPLLGHSCWIPGQICKLWPLQHMGRLASQIQHDWHPKKKPPPLSSRGALANARSPVTAALLHFWKKK